MHKHRLKMRIAAIALPVLIALSLAASASAAPVLTTPTDIYNVPASLPAGPGNLIKYSPVSVNLGAGAPAVKAWRLLYTSSKIDNTANAVTGTVLVPTAPWTGSGGRPTIAYAVGTQGLGKQCAPSKQLETGAEYEIANIVAALKRGYAVVITDNDGYANGQSPTYIVGGNAARALLDAVRAATLVPNVGISVGASPIGIWGYSQGGQTAAAAGEIEASYAPALRVVGVAAGGVPADLRTTAAYLDGGNGESFLLSSIYGLSQQYPSAIPLNTLANANGQAAIANSSNICVFQALFTYMNHSLSEYTVGNQTLNQFLAVPAIGAAVDAQALGTKKIPVPLYLYHGKADEFIPLAPSLSLKQKYCDKGTNVTYDSYPSEHIATQFQAAPQALDFIAARIAGNFVFGTCITLRQKPTSTANNNKGDFIISLDKWNLSGKVGLKTLGQTVNLPSGSTFSANANVSQGTLNGGVSVPPFYADLNIAILPVTVKLSLTPAGPATGTVSVDNNGILHIHGSTQITIGIESLGEGTLVQIPTGCKTSSPVNFPLNYDGPVSDLGGGKVSFSGTTTFPSITNCGAVEGLLTGLMSGPGQTYTYTVAPPGPANY
jgi:dienelactone hydrolase